MNHDGQPSDDYQSNDVIRCRGLAKTYGQVLALHNVDFSVLRGSIFGLLGSNGAGKTTTINILLGLVKPTEGRAEVFGLSLPDEGNAIRQRCGVLLEHSGIYERMSVEENLYFYGRAYGMEAKFLGDRCDQLLEYFDLAERRKEPAKVLSRGMQQKLALASALIHGPELIFLDEPTANLDPVVAADLRRQLVSLARDEGVTIFLTTHNVAEAEQVCNVIGVMREGRLLAVDSPDRLRVGSVENEVIEIIGRGFPHELKTKMSSSPWIGRVDFGTDRITVVTTSKGKAPELTRLVVQSGAEIEEIKQKRSSLEDALLQILKEDS